MSNPEQKGFKTAWWHCRIFLKIWNCPLLNTLLEVALILKHNPLFQFVYLQCNFSNSWELELDGRGVWLQTSTHTLQTSIHTHFRCRQKHPPTRRKLRAGGCLERDLHIIQQRPLGSHFSVGRRIRCNNGTHCTKMWRSAQLHLEVMVGDYSKHSDTIINARDLHFFTDLLVSLSLDFFIKQITERYTNMKHLLF